MNHKKQSDIMALTDVTLFCEQIHNIWDDNQSNRPANTVSDRINPQPIWFIDFKIIDNWGNMRVRQRAEQYTHTREASSRKIGQLSFYYQCITKHEHPGGQNKNVIEK